jgi:hypothetical protein
MLTLEEFVRGYAERNELLERQDALEQRRKLDSLVIRGAEAVLPAEPLTLAVLAASLPAEAEDSTVAKEDTGVSARVRWGAGVKQIKRRQSRVDQHSGHRTKEDELAKKQLEEEDNMKKRVIAHIIS